MTMVRPKGKAKQIATDVMRGKAVKVGEVTKKTKPILKGPVK